MTVLRESCSGICAAAALKTSSKNKEMAFVIALNLSQASRTGPRSGPPPPGVAGRQKAAAARRSRANENANDNMSGSRTLPEAEDPNTGAQSDVYRDGVLSSPSPSANFAG